MQNTVAVRAGTNLVAWSVRPVGSLVRKRIRRPLMFF